MEFHHILNILVDLKFWIVPLCVQNMKFVERMAMSTLKVSDVIVFFQRGGLFHWIYDNGSIQSTGKSLFLEKVESFLILIEYTSHDNIPAILSFGAKFHVLNIWIF